MIKEEESFFMKDKKLSDSSYEPIRDLSHLSPYHQRVSIERKHLEKKQKLRSILILGHLQKMQLNAINNRSIQMMRKARVAEQMSKKRHFSLDEHSQNLPNPKKLKIDNRKNKIKRNVSQNRQSEGQKMEKYDDMERIYDQLINEYLKKAEKYKMLTKKMDRKKIIQTACNEIKIQLNELKENKEKQILTSSMRNKTEIYRKAPTSERNVFLPQIKQMSTEKQMMSEKCLSISTRDNPLKMIQGIKKNGKIFPKTKNTSRYKSLTDIECNQNLKKIQIEQTYLSKQRLRQQKLFLRKMKMIGGKDIRTLRTSLNNNQ